MVRSLPGWIEKARQLKPHEAIVVETDAKTQHAILAHLRKLEGSYTTRRIPGGYRVERRPDKA